MRKEPHQCYVREERNICNGALSYVAVAQAIKSPDHKKKFQKEYAINYIGTSRAYFK